MANILVVDDDYDVLRMMEFTLKRANHHPITTTDPQQGLNLVKQEQPDLIIVDIMMPKLTGYDFTRQVRSEPYGADVPIIIYSARAQSVDKQAALEAGATEYMPKTISPQEIIERVNSLLGELVAQPPAAQSQTLACFSLRGGVGVTSVAVNLAIILAISQKTKICLADLNALAGHANLLMGLRPTHGFSALLRSKQDLSLELVNTFVTPHESGVQLLASPLINPVTKPHHAPEEAIKTINLGYQFTVLDLPHDLGPLPSEIVTHLTKILILVSPDIPSIQSAIAAIKYLDQRGIASDKMAVILNHNTVTANIKLEAIEKALPLPITATIPYSSNMPAAIGAGKPIALYDQKSPTAGALARLAAKIIL